MKQLNLTLLIILFTIGSAHLRAQDFTAPISDMSSLLNYKPKGLHNFNSDSYNDPQKILSSNYFDLSTNSDPNKILLNPNAFHASPLSIKPYSFSLKFGGDCFGLTSLATLGHTTDPLNKNFNSMDDILGKLQCSNIQSGKVPTRFTPSYCQAYSQCTKSFPSNVTFVGMPSILAKEFANYELSSKADLMSNLDKVSFFAQQKYGDKFKSTCSPRFDYDSKKTNKQSCANNSILNEAFNDFQKKCSATNLNCYNELSSPGHTYSAFQETHFKKDNSNQSIVNDFFVDKIKREVDQNAKDDEEEINELAKALADQSSKETKTKNFMDAILKFSLNNKLDPILNFEYTKLNRETFSQSELYKKVSEYVKKGKLTGSIETIKNQLNEMRLELAQGHIGSMCDRTKSIEQICQITSGIKDSKSASIINYFDAGLQLPHDEPQYYEDKKSVLEGIDPNVKEEFYLTLETLRCKAYGFMPQDESKTNYPFSITNISRFDPTDSMYSESIKLSPVEKNGTFKEIIRDHVASNGSVNFSRPEESAGPKFSSSSEKAKNNESEVSTYERDLANQFSTNALGESNSSRTQAPSESKPTNNSPFISHDFTNAISNNISNSAPATPTANENSITSSNNAFNDKIKALEAKVKNSEEVINQMNQEKAQAAEAERVQLGAENAALKAQLDQLKQSNSQSSKNANSKDKNLDDETGLSLDSKNSSQAVSIAHDDRDSGQRDQDQGKGNSSNEESSYSPSSQSSSNYSSAYAESGNQSMGRQIASVGGGSNFGGGNSKGVLTLTRIDGMSSEKAEETIVEMIKANNGAPFTIEEGGYIKQIIPLVVDGQIQYDAITGKPKFEKIIKSKIEKNKIIATENSATTKVTTPADLKQADQEKLSRAERAKLIELTGKAFRTK